MTFTAVMTFAGSLLICTASQGQALAGRPCLFNAYFPEWRCFPAILRDVQGNLTCGRKRLNHGGVTPAPLAAGPPCVTACRAVADFSPQLHFAYRDQAGGIQDLCNLRQWERDQWQAQKLNDGGQTFAPLAAGNPSGFYFRQSYSVVYRDLAGSIQELRYNGAWQAETLSAGGRTSAPAAAGDPVQMLLQGHRHVLYRDRDGGIQDLWKEHGWHARTLNNGGLTEAPAAAGEPAGLDCLNRTHVTYRDTSGQVQDLTFDRDWQVQQLTGGGCTSAPPAMGDPSVSVVDGQVFHVLYRDQQGGIQDLSLAGAWRAQLLNKGGATEAPPAASEPFPLVPPSNWEFVAYVDSNGEGQLLTHFPEKGWAVIPLNADTPPGGPVERWRPDSAH